MWTPENRPKYDRSKLRYPSDLTDEEWSIIAPLIPRAKRGGNKRTIDERAVVNGVMYILSTGCQWAALPKDLPPRSTVNDYLRRWDADQTLDRIHHALYVLCRERAGREASPTAAIIDSQSVKGAEKGGAASTRRATMRARVRLEGAHHLWRKVPSGELSIDPEADERRGWATGLVEAS
jgi:transposase